MVKSSPELLSVNFNQDSTYVPPGPRWPGPPPVARSLGTCTHLPAPHSPHPVHSIPPFYLQVYLDWHSQGLHDHQLRPVRQGVRQE